MPPSFTGAALAIARKDLRIEFRTRTSFFSALVFALLAIIVFYFAWDAAAVSTADRAPGVLWVIFIFSGLLALNRAFNMESHDGALAGLIVAPIPREAIFAGKALANLVFVLGVQAVAIPAVFLFYNVGFGMHMLSVSLVAGLAAVGFVAVGTLFSAMAMNTRLAELLLPMLSLPFFAPLVMMGAPATSRLMSGRPLAESVGWLQMIGAYDLVFVVACAFAFPLSLEA